MKIPGISNALSAFGHAKNTISALKKELQDTRASIARLEGEMAALPKMATPFEDLKAGMLDICEAWGKRHAANNFKAAIIKHATGCSQIYEPKSIGCPMPLGRLERAINTDYDGESAPRFFTGANQHIDAAIYALFFDVVRPVLAEVLETITPEDLGYSKIKRESIGPSRAEMRRLITEKKAQVVDLIEREGELVYQLQELGINVSDIQHEAA